MAVSRVRRMWKGKKIGIMQFLRIFCLFFFPWNASQISGGSRIDHQFDWLSVTLTAMRSVGAACHYRDVLVNRIKQSKAELRDHLGGAQIKQIVHPVLSAEFVLHSTCTNPKPGLAGEERPQIPAGKGLYHSLQRLGTMFLLCSPRLAHTPINFWPRSWVRKNVFLPFL